MKTWHHISVSPIAGALGAEVGGVHLGELGEGALNELREAFIEHQVLFFRDQELPAISTRRSGVTSAPSRFIPTCSRSKTKGIRSSWC